MRKVAIAALLGLTLAFAAHADHPRGGRRDPVAVDRAALLRRLDALERLLDDVAGEPDRRRRATLTARAQRDLADLRKVVADAPSLRGEAEVEAPAPAPPQQPVVYPLHPQSLAQLKASISEESFPRDQLRVLGSAAPANWFLVAQVKELLALFDFPRDRLKAVELLKPRILDPENSYSLYGSFEFPNDKAELKRILDR
jgi:hypothetical protein